MNDTIHIALCCDARYLPYATATMASCIAHCAQPQRLHFHLVALDIEADKLNIMTAFIEAKGSKVTTHSPDERSYAGFRTNQYGPAVYHRISLPDYLQAHARWVIYLDSDLLVLDDIQALWAETQKHPDMATAAVIDYSPPSEKHVDVPRKDYFNSGVLLINIEQWHQQQLHQKTIQYLNENHQGLTFVDQCSLNAVHNGRWHRLHARWNIQGNIYSFWRSKDANPYLLKEEAREATSNPGIIHFVGAKKPWKARCFHPYEFAYRKIFKETPFYKEGSPPTSETVIKGWIMKPHRRIGQLTKILYIAVLSFIAGKSKHPA